MNLLFYKIIMMIVSHLLLKVVNESSKLLSSSLLNDLKILNLTAEVNLGISYFFAFYSKYQYGYYL